MDADRRLERLCERVTLVGGVGTPKRGELCIMSFVALLAGERHTDHPASASPLIRNFAIPVSDAMPRDARQRLKPFAARVVGTDDGCDRARVEALREILAREILPRVLRDWGTGQVAERRRLPLEFLFADAVGRDIVARTALLLHRLERGTAPGHEPRVGSAMGELLALCMHEATTQDRRAWYWNAAISLLDRLCDIGAEPCRRTMQSNQVDRAEERLEGPWLRGMRRLMLHAAGA